MKPPFTPSETDILLARIELHRSRGEDGVADRLESGLKRCPECRGVVGSKKPNVRFCCERCRKHAAERRHRARGNTQEYQRQYYARKWKELTAANTRRYYENREARCAAQRERYATDPEYRQQCIERTRRRNSDRKAAR